MTSSSQEVYLADYRRAGYFVLLLYPFTYRYRYRHDIKHEQKAVVKIILKYFIILSLNPIQNLC